MVRSISAGALFVLCLSVTAVRAADDAEYVGCVIPDSLITDQVFEANITMKNTGTTPWGQLTGQTPVTLVSQAPTFNMTWGTYFIILGQGKTIAPGDTVIFQSRLKAPKTPGNHAFSWRIQRWITSEEKSGTTTPFFGGAVTGKSIYVTLRPGTPPSTPPHKDSLLDSSDFEYAGSIKTPDLPGHENTYTASGLALKKTNGFTHLPARTGTYNYRLYEMTIPELVKIVNGDHSAVHTATVARDWGELEYDSIGEEKIGSNCGFRYDGGSGILYWSHYNEYYCGGADGFPQLMATRLDPGGTKTNLGHWYIPTAIEPFKGYWGGVTALSKRFADAYTAGKDMAVGFGGKDRRQRLRHETRPLKNQNFRYEGDTDPRVRCTFPERRHRHSLGRREMAVGRVLLHGKNRQRRSAEKNDADQMTGRCRAEERHETDGQLAFGSGRIRLPARPSVSATPSPSFRRRHACTGTCRRSVAEFSFRPDVSVNRFSRSNAGPFRPASGSHRHRQLP